MKLSCYIVDDEPLAIEVLESHISRMDSLQIKGTFQNPVKAFQALHHEPVDLLFLDIQMPSLTGIELIKSLSNAPLVIFTTAHREHALAGFELDVVDYLLKPVSFERLLQAIGKVYKYRSGSAPFKEVPSAHRFLFTQEGNKHLKIPLDEILYIESQRDYAKIVMDKKTIKVQERTGALEQKLRQQGFLRIHRSYIIPVSKVESWSSCEVSIKEHVIPIGRTFSSEVLKTLNARMASSQ
ncbi:LytR/AlgR family response regulator transcription factor [Nafulsella turpanensis]|uniref:LytR/AlgR family response regulator transcription factor n=1 Tax=Nafulsella turpanensis TaxID=1265690 RepID=UPI00034D49F7|nr:response regulator transcription factor [Nafulsella turpanensis]